MSSLKSVDMNIERSSTRLHAPPGGASSFSIGGYDAGVSKPVQRNKEPQGGNFLNGFSDNAPVVQRQQPQQQQAAKKAQPSFLSDYSKPAPKAQVENVVPGLPNNYADLTSGHSGKRGAPPVTGKKQSTRVMHAPGGQSSLVIG